jgi:ABC-type amino acid transport substrate-binding protein
MPLLFSYGTLQQEAVLLSTFGRLLAGKTNALAGYVQSMVKIEDADVVAKSGKTHHLIVAWTGATLTSCRAWCSRSPTASLRKPTLTRWTLTSGCSRPSTRARAPGSMSTPGTGRRADPSRFGVPRRTLVRSPAWPDETGEKAGNRMTSIVLRAAFGALLLTGLVAAPAGAQTIDRLKQAKTIRLAVRDDAPPFSFKDANGKPAGFMVDLCEAVVGRLADQLSIPDLKVDYVTVTAADRFDTIASGKADLLCEPSSQTLSRREKIDFSLPTFVDGASLLVKGDGPADFAALAGKKVGVLAGTTTEESLRATLKRMNITADVVAVPTHEEGLKQLQSGALAAYFGDRAILAWLAAKAPANSGLRLATQYFSLETYALALKRGDSDFRLAVDRALSAIYRGGGIVAIWQTSFGMQMEPSDTLKTLYLISALPE